MKKVLFATTALVFTAGAAAAEVTVSGDARMGIVYTEGSGFSPASTGADEQATALAAIELIATELAAQQAAATAAALAGDEAALAGALFAASQLEDALATAQQQYDIGLGSPVGEEFAFSSRIRIAFTASGETDNGLQFGGSIRADNASGGAAGTAGSVFVSGALGKLSMGDVDGAAQAAVGQTDGVGYTSLGDLNELTYISNSVDPTALYEYSFGAATLFASVDQIGNDTTGAGVGVSVGLDDYGMAGVSFAIGYETLEDFGDHVVVGANAAVGDVALKARYGRFNADAGSANDFDQWSISATYGFGPASVTAFYKETDTDFDLGDTIDELEDGNYGIGATYDLGGGAALEGGIVHNGSAPSSGDIRADFGITMKF